MLQAEPTSPLQQANLGMISNYLGTVAQDRGLLDNAADLYARALAISQELGDRPGLAAGYHQLGMVAQAQGRLDEAAGVFAQSLAISEELGDRPGLAAGYHQIGTTAYLRGRLDEAAEWYARAQAIRQELGNRPGLAASYGQLGLLAEQQHSPGRALEWMVRCVALFDEFPHPSTGSGPDYLARLARQLGIKELEARWRKVTGRRLPRAVRDYVDVRAYRPGSRRHSRRSR